MMGDENTQSAYLFAVFFFRDGYVSLQEYMAFMISRETENVQSSSEVEQAFRALTSGEKPYISAQELYAVSNTSASLCAWFGWWPCYCG